MDRAIIIGAGIGGLSAAIALARDGYAVTVLERAGACGGKMREVSAGAAKIDAGPTVLTMRWVFDALFESTNARLDDHVALRKLSVLARHAWSNGARLDLHADIEASVDAIGAFAGASEAHGYRRFCADSRRMYDTLRDTFLTAAKPNPVSLSARVAPAGPGALLAIRPFDTMWHALGGYFRDPRLRQLFGRYATYCGASPFRAPATLMLIAHVEQDGVWIVEGGMQRLAEALAALAERLGVRLRLNAEAEEIELNGGRAAGVRLCSGERIEASTIVCNADPSALAAGIFGERAARAIGGAGGAARSLSAITWAAQAETDGLPLLRHNVFFSDDYAAEFDTLQRGALPGDATIYVCAQDRDESGEAHGSERLLILANAPPCGDTRPLTSSELDACAMNMMTRLRRCGVKVTPQTMTRTAPSDFHALFPATGGALYGRATHGWAASFQRPGARTKLPGLYLAGGGVHPGAGVPMASLSGQLAARRILQDRASTPRFRRAATPGGTSMRSAMTNSTA